MSVALDLHLSPEQRELYVHTRRLARETFAPLVDAAPSGAVNRPLIRALAE